MKCGEISRALTTHLDTLVAQLLPNAVRMGNHWICGSSQGECGQSFRLNRSGARKGCWYDFATCEYGDLLDLVAASQHLSLKDAKAWSVDWLGAGHVASYQSTKPAPIPYQEATHQQERKVYALRIWHDATSI